MSRFKNERFRVEKFCSTKMRTHYFLKRFSVVVFFCKSHKIERCKHIHIKTNLSSRQCIHRYCPQLRTGNYAFCANHQNYLASPSSSCIRTPPKTETGNSVVANSYGKSKIIYIHSSPSETRGLQSNQSLSTKSCRNHFISWCTFVNVFEHNHIRQTTNNIIITLFSKKLNIFLFCWLKTGEWTA